MIAQRGFREQLVFGAALLFCLGCARSADRPLAPAEGRLLNLGNAYVNATSRLKRPPKSFAELKPNLEGAIPDDFLRSPNDGENYVIIWGVDYNHLPPGKNDPFTIAAYEKIGANGKRYVLRFPKSVVALTDDEFQKAVFPPGHKPAP